MTIKTFADLNAAVATCVDDYIECYELDDGEGRHEPTEHERLLIADAINGLIADEEFMALMRTTVAMARDSVPAFAHPPAAEVQAPSGPRTPDPAMVICPACTSQFVATPEDVQAEVQRLRDALKEILVYGDGAKGFVADSVRKIARCALEGK